MKKKFVKTLLSLTVAAAMISGPAGVMAAQAETETTEGAADKAAENAGDETDKDTDAAADKKDEPAADFDITLEAGNLTVKNQTTREITKAELKQAEPDKKGDKEAKDEEKSWELILTEKSGDTHTFSKVEAEQWKEPVLVDEYGFLYVRYQDANGKDQEALETADEKKFDKPITIYVSTNVNIRKAADKDSESLKVAALGEEWKMVAAAPGWFKVEKDSVSGYAYHSYLTEDKAAVEAALKAKQEAEAAAAAAAAQAQAEAEAAAEYVEPEAPQQEVYEVSREAYDDCDGSGHGYYEITYSDGSVAYEDY